jgi:hypothetical protein
MLFGKLISMLAQAKGAAVATVFIASGMTATVAATTPTVQDTVSNVTTSISTTLSAVTQSAKSCTGDGDSAGGQPEVVAQRNAADKLLRDAWGDGHKKLEQLRGGKDVDNKAVGDIVKSYDGQLKDVLDKALNDVAALTLGREGQLRKDASDSTASATAKPSKSPETSKSPKPSCSPKPSPTGSPNDGTTSGGTAPKDGSGSAAGPRDGTGSVQGRVAVANRTTLNAEIKAIVEKAIKDMDALVKKATDEAAALPAPDRGKPEDKGQPEDKGKPSDKPGNGNKPSTSPRA